MAKKPTNASTKPIPNTWYVTCYYKKGGMDVHQFKKAKAANEFKKKMRARCDQVEIEHPYETGFDDGLKHGKQALKPVVKVKDTSWETDGKKLMVKKRESVNPGYADEEMHRDFVAGYETGFKQAWLEKVNQTRKVSETRVRQTQAQRRKQHEREVREGTVKDSPQPGDYAIINKPGPWLVYIRSIVKQDTIGSIWDKGDFKDVDDALQHVAELIGGKKGVRVWEQGTDGKFYPCEKWEHYKSTPLAFIIKEHYIGGGWQPAQLDENDVPITYTTRARAEKEIKGIMADFPKDDPEDYRVFVYKPKPNKSAAASAQRQRPGMRSTISKVLKAHGESIESLKAKGAIKILNEPYMPLSLDYLGNNGKYDMFAVAHNYIQNGDVMADPDMQFVDDGTYWYPTTFQNDGIGVYKEVYEFDVGGNFSKVNPRLKAELESFSRTWARNIDQQGFAGGKLAARNECFKRKSKRQ